MPIALLLIFEEISTRSSCSLSCFSLSSAASSICRLIDSNSRCSDSPAKRLVTVGACAVPASPGAVAEEVLLSNSCWQRLMSRYLKDVLDTGFEAPVDCGCCAGCSPAVVMISNYESKGAQCSTKNSTVRRDIKLTVLTVQMIQYLQYSMLIYKNRYSMLNPNCKDRDYKSV